MNKSKVFLRVNRVDAGLCVQALEATVSDLHEAAWTNGRVGLMSSRMRPPQKGRRIAGPAVTAFCALGDNLMMHRALYLAKPGDVLVVVVDGENAGAQWGDMATRYAMKKGPAGVVVQGSARDTDTVEALGCAVWATQVRSIHSEKCGHGMVNAPVVCNGVLVNPGDLIVAGGDGVVCVPKADAAVVQGALARMRREEKMAKAIERGEAIWDLGGSAASYAAMKNIEEIDGAFDDR